MTRPHHASGPALAPAPAAGPLAVVLESGGGAVASFRVACGCTLRELRGRVDAVLAQPPHAALAGRAPYVGGQRLPEGRAAENIRVDTWLPHVLGEHLLIDLRAEPAPPAAADPGVLHSASYDGAVSRIQQALDGGTEADACDKDGHTALMCAAHGGHLAACRCLIAAGASVNAHDRAGLTPLLCAARGGHRSVCEEVLRSGAEVEARDVYGRTALMHAAEAGDAALCRLLVDCGAEVNGGDARGGTALALAMRRGHVDVCALLLRLGAARTFPE